MSAVDTWVLVSSMLYRDIYIICLKQKAVHNPLLHRKTVNAHIKQVWQVTVDTRSPSINCFKMFTMECE